MKNRHLQRLKRKRLRYEKAGNATPIDPITGEDIGPGAENHHIAGRKYHDDTIPLMPTGHHMVTDAFRDMPASIPGPVKDLDRFGRYILGAIIVLDFVLDRLWEIGEKLISVARAEAYRELQEQEGAQTTAKDAGQTPK